LTTTRRTYSTETTTTELKPNPYIVSEWSRFVLVVPMWQSAAAGGSTFSLTMLILVGMVITKDTEANYQLFTLFSCLCGAFIGLGIFFVISLNNTGIATFGGETKKVESPVIFEDNTPEEVQTGWVRENNRAAKVDFSPMTAALYNRLGQYKAGDVMTREHLKDALINYTENYSKLRTALRTAGAIDENNIWTPAGVQWAKGE